MLKSNLKVLLAERNLSITQVSNETGISRTTLTSLIFGYAKGIQFETMNTICSYLKITPEDLFLYVPYDVQIDLDEFKYIFDSLNNYISFFIEVSKETKKYKILFIGYVYNFGKGFDIQLDLYQELEDEEDKDDFKNIKFYLKKLPIQFFIEVENKIKKMFLEKLEDTDFYEKINEKEEIEFEEDKIKEEDIIIDIEWTFLNE